MILRFSIFSRVGVSALIAVAVLGASAVHVGARDGSKDWVVLENCRLITNPANDGDSFHVSAGEKEYLFRLYFVDAPETDEMTPRRVSIEQAKYFGITVPQAIEVGRDGERFHAGETVRTVHCIHAYVRCDGSEQIGTLLRLC